MIKKEKVLILGISGHIGYTTAIYLNNMGYKVVGTYNKNYPTRFINLKKHKIKIIKCKVSETKKLDYIISKFKINKCVYCAAVPHEIYAKKDPLNAIEANAIGIHNLIKIQERKNFNLILISTGSVFQEVKDSKKITEKIIPTPKSIYSATKRLGEIILEVFSPKLIKKSCILRISWVYGPPIVGRILDVQRGPIPNILYEIIKKKKTNFKLKSGKKFKASFTYIDDVNKAIFTLLKKKKFKKNCYHLGTGINNSFSEIFKILKKINKNIKFDIGDGAKPWSNDSVMRGPLVSTENDFKAKTTLESGIRKYLKWLKINA